MITNCSTYRKYSLDDFKIKPKTKEETEAFKNKEERIEKIFRGAVKDYYDNQIKPDLVKEKDYEFYRRFYFKCRNELPLLYKFYNFFFFNPRYDKVYFKSNNHKIDRKSLPPEIRDEAIFEMKQRHIYEYVDRKVENELILKRILKSDLHVNEKVELTLAYEKYRNEVNEIERKEYESFGFKLE